MRYLIVGGARSGTTALYFKMKQALPEMTWCLYEPAQFDPSGQGDVTHVLAKILIGRRQRSNYESFKGFDKKILIIRDPRDNMLSRLLYLPCGRESFRNDQSKLAIFVDALRRKEIEPRAISFLSLCDLFSRLDGRDLLPRMIEHYKLALDFHYRYDHFMSYKYEDLIAERYAQIEQYLDLPLPRGEALLTKEYDHIARSKRVGDWTNWFTDEDVAFLRPHL